MNTGKLKSIFIFTEPEPKEQFILKENETDKKKESDSNKAKIKIKEQTKSNPQKNDDNEKSRSKDKIPYHLTKGENIEIVGELDKNLEFIKTVFYIPQNGDVVLREFEVIINQKPVPAFAVYIDGLADRKVVADNILNPLMVLSNLDIKSEVTDIMHFVKKHLMAYGQIMVAKTYDKVIEEINFGGCAVFIDGMRGAFTADVKGWEHRNISRPNTELVIRGPQEGFNEVLRVNTALVRKILKDEDLIVETILIGERSKTPCSLMYIKDIANDSLVNEVRRRLKSIKTDYLIDSGELEQLIEDSSYLPTPQLIATERPDRVAAYLSKGKVAVMMHGSPFCLVMPACAASLFHASEDSYIRFPYSNFLRLVRFLAATLSLLLPGIYVAVTNFHVEMLPTDLLLAIAASREKVPFPVIVEILIMEFSFELIREAGIRIPGPIGPTLGIIGALILGQAAVAANIVSPILIIIVAVTGIGSFAVPNFSAAFGFRILRFIYIILGAIAGFLGITLGLFLHVLLQVDQKSFGVPFMTPLAPKAVGIFSESTTREKTWNMERRPDYLNTKDDQRQPKICRKWVIPQKKNSSKNRKEDSNEQ